MPLATFAFERADRVTVAAAREAVMGVVNQTGSAVKAGMGAASSVGRRTGVISIEAPKEELTAIVGRMKAMPEIKRVERIHSTPFVRATLVR